MRVYTEHGYVDSQEYESLCPFTFGSDPGNARHCFEACALFLGDVKGCSLNAANAAFSDDIANDWQGYAWKLLEALHDDNEALLEGLRSLHQAARATAGKANEAKGETQ